MEIPTNPEAPAIVNVNTLAQDVLSDYNAWANAAQLIEIYVAPDERKGFIAGVKALQMRILKHNQNFRG